MNFKKKYRITLEDESSLEKKINFSARYPVFLILLFFIVVLAGAFGIFILASTPMKNYLPGYLKESERTATEEQHLRLDSLVHVYEVNEAYISGILNALNPNETRVEEKEQHHTVLNPDSLLPPSDVEKEFMEKIRERDKYNIISTSPVAAHTMMFGNLSPSAVITEDSKEKYKTEIIIPSGSPVTSVAEGKVITVFTNPSESGANEIIIQHPKGFLSKTGRLGNVMVSPGERVTAGQIIAIGTSKNGAKKNLATFELWHNGDQLLPVQYLNGGQFE